MSQNLTSNIQIFASALIVRQDASGLDILLYRNYLPPEH